MGTTTTNTKASNTKAAPLSRAKRPTVAPLATAPVTARGARTRAALVKAARALFEKSGYIDVNVDHIARRARVAHGTFYTYFSSKEEIFLEVVDGLVGDLQRVGDDEPAVSGELSERIERANRRYIRAYQANGRMMAVLEQVATFNPRFAAARRERRRFWVDRATESICRWQQNGLVDQRIDARYAANALGSMVDRSAYVWVVLGEPYELDEATEQLTRLYCNALRLPYHRDKAAITD